MRVTRASDASVYIYLKDAILAPLFAEVAVGESLSLSSSDTWDMSLSLDMHPFRRDSYSGRGRGLLYFDYDSGTNCSVIGFEQTNLVTVYSGATTASGYRVNYLAGQIESSQDLSGYSVDYQWNYVAVLDEWVRDDVPELPFVCIVFTESDSKPLQLGGGDIRDGFWMVEVFANNKGERDDITDIIYDAIWQHRCPLYLFNTGFPLTRRGFFNPAFSTDLHTYYKSLHFENVRRTITNLPKWGFYEQERINRFRSRIEFDSVAYKS